MKNIIQKQTTQDGVLHLVQYHFILRSQMDIHPAAEYQASGLLSALASAA